MMPTLRILTAVSGLVTILGACSDPVSTEDEYVGGPENPARDGSYTAAIVSQNGVASLEPVMLGGVEQWILIRGHDVGNPVLIYLHGGPGSPAILYGRFAFSGLEQHFTVVTWDQRGCGKSYSPGIDAQTITRHARAHFDDETTFCCVACLSDGRFLWIGTRCFHRERLSRAASGVHRSGAVRGC